MVLNPQLQVRQSLKYDFVKIELCEDMAYLNKIKFPLSVLISFLHSYTF